MKITSLQQMSALAQEVNLELLHPNSPEAYHPALLELVLSAGVYLKFPLFILLKTLLRFSDLRKFDYGQAIVFRRFLLQQTKTKCFLSVPFVLSNEDLQVMLLSDRKLLFNVKYDSLYLLITRFCRSQLSGYPMAFKHGTHIFRHFQASHLSKLGLPVPDIASKLGNSPSTCLHYYIHNHL